MAPRNTRGPLLPVSTRRGLFRHKQRAPFPAPLLQCVFKLRIAGSVSLSLLRLQRLPYGNASVTSFVFSLFRCSFPVLSGFSVASPSPCGGFARVPRLFVRDVLGILSPNTGAVAGAILIRLMAA